MTRSRCSGQDLGAGWARRRSKFYIGGTMAIVLLAEDDADIRRVMTFKLEQSGHQVRAFGDGASAVADALRHHPDLAVLDVVMPNMSGLDVCRELRRNPATAAVPIIILTARGQLTDIDAGFAAGATDYIVKPFSPRALAERVQFLLGASRPSCP
jgi:DNA-binding response OmpR family regulator